MATPILGIFGLIFLLGIVGLVILLGMALANPRFRAAAGVVLLVLFLIGLPVLLVGLGSFVVFQRDRAMDEARQQAAVMREAEAERLEMLEHERAWRIHQRVESSPETENPETDNQERTSPQPDPALAEAYAPSDFGPNAATAEAHAVAEHVVMKRSAVHAATKRAVFGGFALILLFALVGLLVLLIVGLSNPRFRAVTGVVLLLGFLIGLPVLLLGGAALWLYDSEPHGSDIATRAFEGSGDMAAKEYIGHPSELVAEAVSPTAPPHPHPHTVDEPGDANSTDSHTADGHTTDASTADATATAEPDDDPDDDPSNKPGNDPSNGDSSDAVPEWVDRPATSWTENGTLFKRVEIAPVFRSQIGLDADSRPLPRLVELHELRAMFERDPSLRQKAFRAVREEVTNYVRDAGPQVAGLVSPAFDARLEDVVQAGWLREVRLRESITLEGEDAEPSPLLKMQLLLHFDEDMRRGLIAMAQERAAWERIVAVGSLSAFLLAAIGSVLGYLKLDEWTDGRHRGWLRLSVTVAILVVLLSGAALFLA